MANEPKWAEFIIKMAGKLGFSEVRTRWRLQKYLDKQDTQGESAPITAARVYTKCYHCRALQSPEDKICDQCGKPIKPNLINRFSDLKSGWGETFNAPTTLLILYIIAYLRVFLAQSSGSFWQLDSRFLGMHGAVYPHGIFAYGEWWRLIAAIYLHGALLHIGFNLYATMILAPRCEELLGRGRVLLMFLVCGVMGFIGTIYMGNASLGASGGIMGFLGYLASWGHRDGTPFGIETRNFALQWLLIVTIFGILMGGTDHTAHFVGFLTGAAFGFLVRPASQLKIAEEKLLGTFSYVVFAVLTLYGMVKIIVPY